jgi:lipoyl(octanoyl) transferase
MSILIRNLGQQAYEPIWKQMQSLTLARDEHSSDEIWLLEHPPVYTLGLNGKREHLIRDNGIPVIPVDRGGQVTYHGPGQTVAYVLCDIQRLGLGANEFVKRLEQSLIDLLNDYAIHADRKLGAPGVYVDGRKIAALGLRIKHGRSYHGLSLNVDMDLGPFQDINPCGYPELEVTQLKDLGVHEEMAVINQQLIKHLQLNLGYNNPPQDINKL